MAHGEGCWRSLPKAAGLLRCGKSCRLRWINYLRPDLKRGNFTEEEDELIIKFHSLLGNKWSLIAGRLPGRTNNEIKNYWNTHIRRKLLNRGIDPATHQPVNDNPTNHHRPGTRESVSQCLSSAKRITTELGDELEFHVINDPLSLHDEESDELESKGDTKNTTDREIESCKAFEGKKSSPLAIALEAGKKPMVMDSSRANWKTAPIELPQEVIEGQFGNTMKEAAKNLKVSLSTLKRKCKEYHIKEWQGPNAVKKKKVNASNNNQSNANEEDNGEIQEPSIVNRNEKTLIIKAEYMDNTIKFDLRTSQASLVNIEKEIGKKLNLTYGTYKLKYLDKEEDLILLTSDQDVSDCIKYFRNLGLSMVRLRVLLSPQKPSF